MARELRNVNVTMVSYVDKAANGKKFFLLKSEDGQTPNFQKEIKIITKADDPQKLVYGIVYEPGVEDAHGDFMTEAEVEKAAHSFMQNLAKYQGQVMDEQHNFISGAGFPVESYIAPTDFTIGDTTIKKGTWVLVSKASDEVWEKIQKGEITGYSLAGTAEVVDDVEVTKAKNLFKLIKDFFTGGATPVQKGEVQDKFYAQKKVREFWDALYIFEEVFYDEIWKGAQVDVERISAAAMDFANLLQDIAKQPDILKSLTSIGRENIKKSRGDDEVTPEQMKELLEKALEPVQQRLETLEKSLQKEETQAQEAQDAAPAAESQDQQPATSDEELIAKFQGLLKEALDPIAERLERVEKARGISKGADTDTAQVQKTSGSVWDGLL